MEVNSINKGYRKYNEDVVVVIKDHLFIIIDSATGLTEPFNSPSDGVYLANKLKEEILIRYKENKLKGKTFVKEMNRISNKIYKDFIKGHKIDCHDRYQFPNASIAVCLIEVCDVHIYSIGDASTFIRFNNNQCKYISDKSIPLMDKKVVENYHKQGIFDFYQMLDKLKENRNLLNKNGRKATFSLYKKAHLKWKYTLLDIRDLKELYLCSDGYYSAFEELRIFKSRKELFSKKNDLQDVYRLIVKESERKDTLKEHPRLKKIDDISAIRIVF